MFVILATIDFTLLGITIAVYIDSIISGDTPSNQQAPEIPTLLVIEERDLVERGMPALKEYPELSEKMRHLTECAITLDTFREPILANDLYIYDYTTAAYKNLKDSTFTREEFSKAPFPFSYKKLKELCNTVADHTKTIEDINQNLLKLAMCPVSGKLMQHPEIVHLKHTTYIQSSFSSTTTDFMLVCDKTALEKLPQEFQIVRRRAFDTLRDVLIHQKIIQDTDYKAPDRLPSLNDWNAAFEQCKNDFRSVHLPAATVTVGSNPHTMFHPSANVLTDDEHLSDEHNHTMGPA